MDNPHPRTAREIWGGVHPNACEPFGQHVWTKLADALLLTTDTFGRYFGKRAITLHELQRCGEKSYYTYYSALLASLAGGAFYWKFEMDITPEHRAALEASAAISPAHALAAQKYYDPKWGLFVGEWLRLFVARDVARAQGVPDWKVPE